MNICQHHTDPVDSLLYPKGVCVECRREKGRRHYQKHREKVLAKCAEYRRANPEKVKAAKAKYFQETKGMTFLTGVKQVRHRKLTGMELQYVCKLREILSQIRTIERQYNDHFRI